jgi:carboxypeptidase Q
MGQIREETRAAALFRFCQQARAKLFPARGAVRYHLRMKLALAGILLASLLSVYAQSAPPAESSLLPPEEQSALVRLGGQLMVAGEAYEYDRQLADDIGPRLTGSANYNKAAAWAESEFTRLGLSNVHRESWEIPATWEPETLATARMLKPHEQRLHLESEGWSPSTPEGGVRGSVFYVKELNSDAVKANAAQIKDAVVLVDIESLMSEKVLRFGRLFDSLRMIGDEGARGLIFGLGTTNNAPSMIGNTSFIGALANVPCGNLGEEDTLLLKRLLKEGPVEVEFGFKNRIREHVKVDNVVAEIPGRESNGEYVLIGGHLDSWNPGTGAQDNGTGASTVLAVAQAIKAVGLQPRRTMRFVLFGGEEEGLIGSVHYTRDHTGELEKCVGVFVSDSGAEAPKGWYTFGRDDENRGLAPLTPLLSALGAGGTSDDGLHTFQTDEAPFLVHGIPSFVLWTNTEKYALLHHKPSDTFDKVDQRDLNLGVAVVGITAYAFADAPTTVKHLDSAEVESEFKKLKVLEQYHDLEEHKMF